MGTDAAASDGRVLEVEMSCRGWMAASRLDEGIVAG
jgi:hypothetical protein